MASTFRSWPEYKSVEAFILFVEEDDRADFSHQDLEYLNFRTHIPIHIIRRQLETAGLTLKVREPERRVRGFQTSSNDRWFGPGSEATHGGSGFSSSNFDE